MDKKSKEKVAEQLRQQLEEKKKLEEKQKEFGILIRQLGEKSQDTFERQLAFISSSGIGATMFLVDKLFEKFQTTIHQWTIVFGWALLGATLLTNLYSHAVGAKFHYQTSYEIECGNYNQEKAERRRKIINWMNIFSMIFLGLGVIFVTFFVSINLINGKGNN